MGVNISNWITSQRTTLNSDCCEYIKSHKTPFQYTELYMKISLTETEVGNKMQKCCVPSLFSGSLVTTLWMDEMAFKYRR